MQMAARMAPIPAEPSVMWIDAKVTWDVKAKIRYGMQREGIFFWRGMMMCVTAKHLRNHKSAERARRAAERDF